jgi:hypothetical protein
MAKIPGATIYSKADLVAAIVDMSEQASKKRH